jgi:glycosyltransferase involved in cell wall biosynthesis
MSGPSSSTPFFSVIIPVFNRANVLSESVRSVLSQTHSDFEIIVVDDGSHDRPDLVLQQLPDSRIRVIRQENKGSGLARQAGINVAAGRYIAFLDSDDLFLAHKLERVHSVLQSFPEAWIYHYCYMDRGNGVAIKIPSRPLRENESLAEFFFVHRQFMATPALVIPTSLCRKVTADPLLRKAEDLDFYLHLDCRAPRPVFVPEVLTIVRDWSSQGRASRNRRPEDLRYFLAKNRALIGTRACHGLRATMLSYEIAPTEPLLALKYLLVDACLARLPIRVAFLSILRAFMPPRAYRFLVNWALRARVSLAGDGSLAGQTESVIRFRP